MAKIAIMGGTFDPIHVGHLAAADAVVSELKLDRVLFVPTGSPPHKTANAAREDRYLMTEIAAAANVRASVARVETDRPGRSYTVDTLRELSASHPRDELFFVVGSDSVDQVVGWKNFEVLRDMCVFVVINRPGAEFSLPPGFVGVSAPPLAVSSTEIRGRVAESKSFRYLTGEKVAEYISEFGLYSDTNKSVCAEKAVKIRSFLNENLSKKRLAHTLATASESVRLAVRFGAPPASAYLAGLAHDCAKCMSGDDLVKICRRNALADKDLLSRPKLLHAVVGAFLARTEFGLDADEAGAVRWHTTGKKNMTLLEKVVYLADFIEPTRDFPEVHKARELAEKNLDDAIRYTLSAILDWNEDAHPDSVDALKFMTR